LKYPVTSKRKCVCPVEPGGMSQRTPMRPPWPSRMIALLARRGRHEVDGAGQGRRTARLIQPQVARVGGRGHREHDGHRPRIRGDVAQSGHVEGAVETDANPALAPSGDAVVWEFTPFSFGPTRFQSISGAERRRTGIELFLIKPDAPA
jgi:hypothetical protein